MPNISEWPNDAAVCSLSQVSRSGFDPASVLFEFNGLRRDSAPSREKGEEVAPTIAGCSNGGGANGPGRDVDGVESLRITTRDLSPTITSNYGKQIDSSDTALGPNVVMQPIAWSEELTPSINVAGTIQYGGQGGRHDGVMQSDMQVRRLTPLECERLQGFNDNYTLIQVREKPAADGARYKALGNSMAVPVMRWIGSRIAANDNQPS